MAVDAFKCGDEGSVESKELVEEFDAMEGFDVDDFISDVAAAD